MFFKKGGYLFKKALDLMRKDEDFFDKCPHLSQIIPTTSFSHIQ